jgi:hypothetical protein
LRADPVGEREDHPAGDQEGGKHRAGEIHENPRCDAESSGGE